MSFRWLMALAAVAALAHGPMHEQITIVSAQIAKDPRNAHLYLKRGELRRVHQEFQAAAADYRRAEALDSKLIDVELCRARLRLQMQKPASAIPHLDRFLAAKPGDEEGLATRAIAREQAGNARGAVDDYTAALGAGGPKVDYYLGRARVQESLDVPAAIAGLDEGMRQLGPLVTLQEMAIKLERQRGQIDGALARLQRMSEQSARKELYLVRRGEILREAGRVDEANTAFAQAREAIEALPVNLRATRAVADLEKRAATP